MEDGLKAALAKANAAYDAMTPEQQAEMWFEQRVSFVYGQQDYDDPHPLSKDQIRDMLRNPQLGMTRARASNREEG